MLICLNSLSTTGMKKKRSLCMKNCHQAMPKDSKLLLFETVIYSGNEPFFGKLLDLNMLVITGGREPTEAEYQTLLKDAGFQLTRIILPPGWSA
ncbi:MAG: methyltransferase [Heteroscytonema crispum UTEX LB 1556]